MKQAIKKWFQKGTTEDQKGDPRKKCKSTEKCIPTTSARKYKYMGTRTTGNMGGGRK